MSIYRSDADLAFLKSCDNEDLDMLVSILTVDPKDKKPRYTEELTSSNEYKQYYPDHQKYWECIAAELQTFGANSIVTKALRKGQGIPYREILMDVCKKKKVNFNKNSPIEVIEMNLLMRLLEQTLNEMTKEQLNEFVHDMGMELMNPTPELILMAAQSAIKLSGFAAYTFATRTLAMLLRQIGLKASFVVYTSMTTAMGIISGPIGWGATAAWLATDLASPAYRVTVPACVIIAYMRQKSLNVSAIPREVEQN